MLSAHRRLTRRSAAVLAALLIALVVLPGLASARTIYDREGFSERSTPAPTVVRTVVREEVVRVLPIALAGAALIIAIAGTGFALARVAPRRQQLRS
jgi:hypothetical protein